MTKKAGAHNGQVVFQPRARILRLLGEELISDEIIAVAELMKNAHDAVRCFTQQSRRQIDIRVWARADTAGFDFSDNGPGIPADRAEEVFLPHYTTRPGAAGMGLTIVREICRSHGGEASILAGKGGGTTVRVELKRKQARATMGDGS